MIVLAFDTSAPVGSVAVGREGRILAHRFLGDRREHARRLVPAIEEVLDEAGAERSEVAAVVVGEGPGSFTGVRVAAAVAKGLIHVLGCELIALSSLASAALGELAVEGEGPWPASPGVEPLPPAETEGASRYVLFDARGERVYAARYRVSGGRIETEAEPRGTVLGDVLDELEGSGPGDVVLVGDGALRHRDRIRDAGLGVLPPPAGMPTAGGLIHLLELVDEVRPVEDPAAWEPAYLRPTGAERADAADAADASGGSGGGGAG